MKKEFLIGAALLLSGCANQPSSPQEPAWLPNTHYVAIGHQSRITTVVLHYTVADERRSLELLTGPHVSSHYLIAQYPKPHQRYPQVFQLVPEDQAAWHAGVSTWRGTYNLNSTSIGIELVNPGFSQATAGGYSHCQAYPPAQIEVLIEILTEIARRYAIAPENIVGHSDIAPLRKLDPGPCFPWQQLAEHGLGAWPSPALVQKLLAGRDAKAPVANDLLLPLLKQYGYVIGSNATIQQQRQLIRAFQMHFQSENISGRADQLTLARLQALLLQYPRQR